MKKQTCARIVGAVIICAITTMKMSFFAQSENPPPIMVVEFDIDRQVDSVRYVDKAIMRNDVYGNTIFEFTANRTDLPDTRERWTVTIENDPSYEHIAHIAINGDWTYSSGTFVDLNNDPRAEMSISGQTVHIDVVNPCDDPSFADYQLVLGETATERNVVDEVLNSILDQILNDESEMPCADNDCWDNEDFQNCDSDCLPFSPPGCQGWLEFDDCDTLKECCLAECANLSCFGKCVCDHCCPDAEKKDECHDFVKGGNRGCVKWCQGKFNECMAAKNCP